MSPSPWQPPTKMGCITYTNEHKQHHNMVSRPVFNADSDYAIGGSIFLVMTEVSTVT